MVDAAADQDWWSSAPIADTPIPASAPRITVTPKTPGSPAPSDDDWWKSAPIAPFADRFSGEGMAIPQNAPALTAGLKKTAQRAGDEKLAAGDAGGQVKTFIENAANTLMLNAPRNVEAYFKSRKPAPTLSTLITGDQSKTPSFDEAYQQLKAEEEAGNRLNPKSALGGTAAGIVAGAAVLPGIGGGASLTARAGRAALTGAGYGAVAEALDSKDPVHVAVSAALGGALGGIAAPIAEKIVGLVSSLVKRGKTADAFLKPDGTLTEQASEAARAAGIDPATFGQVLHRKFAETFASKGATPAAAREAAAGEFNIPLTRGQASQDLDAIRFEDMSARGAYGKPAQDVANDFQTTQRDAIRSAGTDIGERTANGRVVVETPHTAASTVNSEVGAHAARARCGDASRRRGNPRGRCSSRRGRRSGERDHGRRVGRPCAALATAGCG